MRDFFISYNKADRRWAAWIGWQLEEQGCTVFLQHWDFRPGSNFVLEMQKASAQAKRTIAVLSPDYLSALYTQPEWAAAFSDDPTGSRKTLLPVRVRECLPEGLLKSIVYIDLVGFSESEAQKALIEGLKTERAKPAEAPAFPGEEIARTIPAKPGFPPVISISKLPTTGKDLLGRKKELEILNQAWSDPHIHVVTLVAWGGVGKTALVNHWLNIMERQAYCGVQRVYGWSFYSQGAEEGKQASADEFMQTTLAWFGDQDPKAGSGVEKGRRLAHLIRKEQTLLILEGMEPLFAAVAHGCTAGLHQEALVDVYWQRISRRNEGFIFNKLGAFGSYLTAISHFFKVLWTQPAAGLTEEDKAYVLNWAGFRLRAVAGLRKSGDQDFLALALTKRAECFHHQQKFKAAWEDLQEAKEIAQLGSMKLHLADYHLEAGKLCEAQGKQEDARKHFATAKKMMEEMGYERKLKEVEKALGSCD